MGSAPCYIANDGKITEISISVNQLGGYYLNYPTRTGIDIKGTPPWKGALDIENNKFEPDWNEAYSGKEYNVNIYVQNKITKSKVELNFKAKYTGQWQFPL